MTDNLQTVVDPITGQAAPVGDILHDIAVEMQGYLEELEEEHPDDQVTFQVGRFTAAVLILAQQLKPDPAAVDLNDLLKNAREHALNVPDEWRAQPK